MKTKLAADSTPRSLSLTEAAHLFRFLDRLSVLFCILQKQAKEEFSLLSLTVAEMGVRETQYAYEELHDLCDHASAPARKRQAKQAKRAKQKGNHHA